KLSIVNTDHLTGANVVFDMSGNVQEVMDYYPFGGTRLDEQHNFNEQRKFAGHEFDQDTGLSYMDARYYSSATGRFLSEDLAFHSKSDLSRGYNILHPCKTGLCLGQTHGPQIYAAR